MVLAVALVAVVVFLLASWVRRNAGRASPARLPSARGVLDERLARGEIDVEEYRQRRSAIERTGSQTK